MTHVTQVNHWNHVNQYDKRLLLSLHRKTKVVQHQLRWGDFLAMTLDLEGPPISDNPADSGCDSWAGALWIQRHSQKIHPHLSPTLSFRDGVHISAWSGPAPSTGSGAYEEW